MLGDALPLTRPVEIPAECFNLSRLAQRRFGPTLRFGLPGLPGNVVTVSETEWRCWNRQLHADLLSWSGFEIGARRALDAPIACEMTVHHSYSRTVLHRVHDSATVYLRKLLEQHRPTDRGQLLSWPRARSHGARNVQPIIT
jgi:hypothetical protein